MKSAGVACTETSSLQDGSHEGLRSAAPPSYMNLQHAGPQSCPNPALILTHLKFPILPLLLHLSARDVGPGPPTGPVLYLVGRE